MKIFRVLIRGGGRYGSSREERRSICTLRDGGVQRYESNWRGCHTNGPEISHQDSSRRAEGDPVLYHHRALNPAICGYPLAADEFEALQWPANWAGGRFARQRVWLLTGLQVVGCG